MKKKTFVAAVILSFLVLSSVAALQVNLGKAQTATPVIGIITSDTAWTKSNSPYTLTGPTAVAQGVTLTIEAGTTVDFNAYYIQVNGTLIARGTNTERILLNFGFIAFTTKSSSWNEQNDSGCIIENCNITSGTYYGETRYSFSVTIEGSSPKIISSDIASMSVTDGSPIISKNNIGNLNLNGSPQVSENTIRELHVNGGNPTISSNDIQNRIYPCDGAPIIWNNHISYLPYGESTQESPIIHLTGDAIVSNNYITGLVMPAGPDPISFGQRTIGPFSTFYGIEVSGNAIITNNLISGCTKDSIVVSGGNPTIQNNTLSDEGIIIEAGSAKINYNNIENGISLSQGVSANIDATHNWWGTTNESAIAKLIFDFNNDFNLGKVTFTPFLAEPNPQAMPNPNVSLPILSPTVSSSPNPSPSLSPSPTPNLTPSSSSTQQPTPEFAQTPTSTFGPVVDYPPNTLPEIIGITAIAAVVVVLGLLVYRKRRIRKRE